MRSGVICVRPSAWPNIITTSGECFSISASSALAELLYATGNIAVTILSALMRFTISPEGLSVAFPNGSKPVNKIFAILGY